MREREDATPAIVDYPNRVHELLAQYGNLFASEPERCHFAGRLPKRRFKT
ncbi:MAG: hypothetical protein MI924_12595 [Chloroflexales bacterium]|nr:hypothetical protein [Chloroflexales bacterium]